MDLQTALYLSLGINVVMFIPARLWRTDKLTDISYAATFVIVSTAALSAGVPTAPSIILAAAISIWAIRLGSYLLTRIRRRGKDPRFDEMRGSFWRLGRFWVLQGFTVWVVLLPSIMFFSHPPEALSGYAYGGLVVWAFGLLVEAVADRQKYEFITNPANRGKWIDRGLWKYSRHPNYFGEITLWVGLYAYTLGGLSLGEALTGVVGPLYLALVIVFVSGVPPLEKSADEKWGNDPAYRDYRRRTSVLVPWFTRNV